MESKEELYTEAEGKAPFDWNKALNAPLITNWVEMHHLSGSWVTCACGNQCAIIPRDTDGEPRDGRLSELGYLFHDYINARNAPKAKETLAQIETRSAGIINKILKTTKDEISENQQ